MKSVLAVLDRFGRFRRNGQALVELALVATVLMIILLGIIELVAMFSYRGYLSDGSRAGVRMASLNYGDTDILNAVMRPLTAHGLNTVHNGQCDIRSIEIYDANPDGSVMATTTDNSTNPPWTPYPNVPANSNVEDIYQLTPNNSGSCDLVIPTIPSPFVGDNYIGPSHYFPPTE
ncbi:MAG: TadE/TadG family type IV pilus assembly protein, partial [Chloroflexota bacterium]